MGSVEHIVDCGAQLTDHSAVDEDLSPERRGEFIVDVLLSRDHIEERDRRQREALARLQQAALTDEQVRDILVLLGVEDQ